MNSLSAPKSRARTWLAMAAIPLAVLSSESLAWWWKHPPEPEMGRNLLGYEFPPDSEEYFRVKVSDKVVSELFCDESQSGWVDGGEGRRISVNFFEWNKTDNYGLSQVFGHSPEVCMGNLGNKVEAFLPSRSFTIDGHQLVFDATQFRDRDGRPLYIFKLAWAEGMEGVNLLRDVPGGANNRSFKFKSVARRHFPRHARVMMLGVYGAQDDTEAWELVQRKVLKDLTMHNVKF